MDVKINKNLLKSNRPMFERVYFLEDRLMILNNSFFYFLTYNYARLYTYEFLPSDDYIYYIEANNVKYLNKAEFIMFNGDMSYIETRDGRHNIIKLEKANVLPDYEYVLESNRHITKRSNIINTSSKLFKILGYIGSITNEEKHIYFTDWSMVITDRKIKGNVVDDYTQYNEYALIAISRNE